MDFHTVLDQIVELLRRRGRVSYRALKRQFDLDDEFIEDLKVEIIKSQQLAIDEDGEVLVWIGDTKATLEPVPPSSQTFQQSPTQEDQPIHVDSPPSTFRIPDAERRQLTVLFCDLVDSTKLAGQLDPEDLREVIRAYQHTCAEVIQRFDGHIAQYLGDGLLVYFGYPQAHEDDAQRAVRTGLGMVEAIGTLNARLEQDKGIRLAVRVGIHTGLVVVGEIGNGKRQEQLALGETPNIAARIQGLAHPDTIVISEATYRLIQGYFVTEDCGSHTLKGVAAAQYLYRVVQDQGIQSRLEITSPRGLTPLVGRESELTLLLDRWGQVKKGRGQVVLLSGEAGIGKSRLVKAVKDHLADEPHSQAEIRCSPYHQHSALYPIVDLLQRTLQFQRDDTSEEKLRKLEAMLDPYDLSLPDTVPLFASLLSIPFSERYPPLNLSPQHQRQKTLEALLALRLVIAAQQPVLYIVEDLHWADPSTLEWLELLLEQVSTSRILVLLTCRPEFHPPWDLHLLQIPLNRFDRNQVEVMVRKITGGKTLPPEVLQQIVAKTDGVPLFVEELTKMVLESAWLREEDTHYALTSPLPALAIPTTLHDSLMARLDRLATAKEIAQLGATIGRQFAYEVIQALAPLDESTLQRELSRLVEAELLYQRGVIPQASYLFKHALIQEAAYQSLLKSTRQQYHQQIAQVLEAQFPETGEMQPALVAHHYTEAGCHDQAVVYLQRAGHQAVQRAAPVEAITYFTQGLELLKTLPETPDHNQQALDIYVALGPLFMAVKGYGAPEVEQVYLRAQELCQQLGETRQLFRVLGGLRSVYGVRAEYQKAQELAEQCLAYAQQVQDSGLLLGGHLTLGYLLSYQGELMVARGHLEQCVVLYDPQQHQAWQDPGVFSFSFMSKVLWILGYPEQALQNVQQALNRAQAVSSPYSLMYALFQAAGWLHWCCREERAARERAEAIIALSTEQRFPEFLAVGTFLRGWALAMQGQDTVGITQMRQGLAAYRATGSRTLQTVYLTFLAEAYGRHGQVEEGLNLLTEALAHVNNTGERLWEAEVYRLKGELLLQHPIPDAQQAESSFHQALDVARRQQAKSLELRAAMSLSRLWQQQGKHHEARELLAPIYDWFTEGFDTADLQEAKALLEVLS